jgi:kinesin family protein 11
VVKNYSFDQVLGENCDQATVYKRVRLDYLVKQVIAGFHATVFVYGQTGSGKTFTMDGELKKSQLESPEDGIIPRAIRNLFDLVASKKQQNPTARLTVSIQYIQLYNEKIFDLLNKRDMNALRLKSYEKEPGLKLKWNIGTDEVTVENGFVFECEDVRQALKLY